MKDFRKKADCPSSSDLLSFQRGEAHANWAAITQHLCLCEFCVAEIEFYTHYPQREERVKAEAIPAPLYYLARALLHRGRDSLCWIDSVLKFLPLSKNN